MSLKPPDRDTIALALTVLAGEANDDEVQRLDRRLRDEPDLLQYYVELASREASLGFVLPARALSLAPPLGTTASPTVDLPSPAGISRWKGSLAALAAGLLLATGVGLGLTLDGQLTPRTVAVADPQSAPQSDPTPPVLAARLVQDTACRWNVDLQNTLYHGANLRRGEVLNLLEGIAKIHLNWQSGAADLMVEGPAGLVLTADDGFSLGHGRAVVDVDAQVNTLLIETPNGRVEVGPHASVGVSVEGYEVSIHVFAGACNVIVPWGTRDLEVQPVVLEQGEMVLLARQSDGRLRLARGASRPGDFASLVSMSSDQLLIGRDYVTDVLSLHPLVYWRFDGQATDRVPNVAGEKFAAEVRGSVGFPREGNNYLAAMSVGQSLNELNGYLISTDPLDLGDCEAYSIEMWIKPSHFHLGTVAGLVNVSDPGNADVRHSMTFEICGPMATDAVRERPGAVRFLHRSPAGWEVGSGTSIFSPSSYRVRSWQHIAAVKTSDTIRLYVDGKQVASTPDHTSIPSDMYLIAGQIDANRLLRQYVGQFDELAFYPFALTADDITRHYQLVRKGGDDTSKPQDEI